MRSVVICGDGVSAQSLRARGRGHANLRFLPLQPPGRLNDLLNLADVHLLPQQPGAARSVFPSKLIGMLASGRPIIATCQVGSEIANLVSDCGVITAPGDPEALASAIRQLAANPAARIRMGGAPEIGPYMLIVGSTPPGVRACVTRSNAQRRSCSGEGLAPGVSTAARLQIAVPTFQAANWTPWAILAVDVAALEAALGLGLAVRKMLAPWFTAAIGVEQYFAVAVGILLLPIVHYQLGIYPGYLLGPVERLRRRTLATLAVFGGLVAWDNIVARDVLSRGVLLATLVFALVLPPLAESLARKALVARKRWGIPVVVIGAGSTGRLVVRTLLSEPQFGLVPIALLDNRPDAWNQAVENVPVAGPLGLAQDFERRAEAAIVAMADLETDDVGGLLQELNFPRVIVIPQFTRVASLWVTARDLGGCLGLEIKKNLLVPRNLALKRIMDRAVAMPLFLMSIPIMAAAAVWIKLTSRGPAFYCQMREGIDGRRIAVWKLRTMHVDGEGRLEPWFQEHPEDAPRMVATLQVAPRPSGAAVDRQAAAAHQPRRVAAVVERAERRDEFGGTASLSGLSSRTFPGGVSGVTDARAARSDRNVAGFRAQRRRRRGAGSARHVLHPQLVAVARSVHPRPHGFGSGDGARRVLRHTIQGTPRLYKLSRAAGG